MTGVRSARQPAQAAVLAAALELLRSEGPEALAVRRIAEAADASTQIVYSAFGGKQGLVAGLYEEGFRRLRERFLAVPRGASPLGHLRGLAHAYRAFALEETELFLLMFGRSVPHFRPPAESRAVGSAALAVLRQAVQRVVAADELHGDPEEIARALWQMVHGLAHLEITGRPQGGPDGAAQLDYLCDIMEAGLREAATRGPAGSLPESSG